MSIKSVNINYKVNWLLFVDIRPVVLIIRLQVSGSYLQIILGLLWCMAL